MLEIIWTTTFSSARVDAMADWVRDPFKPELEIIVARPSTAKTPAISKQNLTNGLQWSEPTSDSIEIGKGPFQVTVDEALLRTLAREVSLTAVLEHFVRGEGVAAYTQRLKMELAIRPLRVAMSETTGIVRSGKQTGHRGQQHFRATLSALRSFRAGRWSYPRLMNS